ncbi:uncharacterized protein RCC_04272 [Ramularia collo-cygni]|uniref:Zn(2)-C6 fungal-type domain-containing protein n=1 Tax=Ramularia collo-cygni TaxID=112498 RepID=A0A2D3V198_9PEZI|nr:uncharacterized protein RCC_04272 [Ramularia collo-cygni]CZT18427.1 uncharacterized protein RCC_04272 [Ramularia collo-cygni]
MALSYADGKRRVRVLHEKSRAGCITCKQRRVKCDEAQPICQRCSKGSRECSYATPSGNPTFRGFRHIMFVQKQLRSPIVVSDETNRSVEYFCLKGLPILRSCQPSLLWQFLANRLLDAQQPSIRGIAAALGAQQRLADQKKTSASQTEIISQQASSMYTKAIICLQRSINDGRHGQEPHVPLACLLLVILESMRGSSTSLLVHLESGFRIAGTIQGKSAETVEVARILRQYAVDATVFDALSHSAQSVQALVAGCSQPDYSSDPLAQTVELVLHLTRAIMYAPESASFDITYEPIPSTVLYALRPQQQAIEKALNEKLASPEPMGECKMAAYGFAKAQCLMAKIYIDLLWTGRQVDFDNAIGLFQEVCDILETSLRLMDSLIDGGTPTNTRAAFSVGVSAQPALMLLIQQCRDRHVRQRAMKLLDQCPQYHGVRDTVLVKAICHAIITFEENGIERGTDFIPESHRVHHYRLIGSGDEPGGFQAVKLFCSNPGGEGLIAYDVPLDMS